MIFNSYKSFLHSQDLSHPGEGLASGQRCQFTSLKGEGFWYDLLKRGGQASSHFPHPSHPSSCKWLQMNPEEKRRPVCCWFHELNWFSKGSSQCQSACKRRSQERAAVGRGWCWRGAAPLQRQLHQADASAGLHHPPLLWCQRQRRSQTPPEGISAHLCSVL